MSKTTSYYQSLVNIRLFGHSRNDASKGHRVGRNEQSVITTRNLALTAASLAFMSVSYAQAQQLTEQTTPADSFVDSIGVNTHLGDRNSAYFTDYKSVVKTSLMDLGIRHVRDGLENYWSSDIINNFKDLASNGISFDFIGDGGSISDFMSAITNKIGVSHVTSVEGINEPDIVSGAAWKLVSTTYQTELFNAVNSNSAMSGIKVLGSALGKNDATLLGAVTAEDYGNIHPYMGGRNPETRGWGSNGYGSLAWNFTYMAEPITGSRPVVATECGLHNATATTSAFPYTPLDVSACYIPRMYLYYYSHGVPTSYLYELLDEGTVLSNNEDNFGLVTYNHGQKPAFKALRNLITMLKDPGVTIGSESLTYTLSGNTTNVYHVLLEKRNGSFYMALWLGMQDFDPNAKVYQWHTPQTISLNFGRAMSRAYVSSPVDSAVWTPVPLDGNTVTVPVGDKVTLLRLQPTKPHVW